MPRRKISKRVKKAVAKLAKPKKKQHKKQMVKKRLMELNLRLDGHIYQNKLISAINAQQYIKEIAELQQVCNLDNACLQVIDKLTRIMKAIAEDNNTEGKQCNPKIPVTHVEHYDRPPFQYFSSEHETENRQSMSQTEKGLKALTLDSVVTNIDKNEIAEIPQVLPPKVAELSRALTDLSVHDPDDFVINLIDDYDEECPGNSVDHYSELDELNSCGQGFEEYDRAINNITSDADELNKIQFKNDTGLACLKSYDPQKVASSNDLLTNCTNKGEKINTVQFSDEIQNINVENSKVLTTNTVDARPSILTNSTNKKLGLCNQNSEDHKTNTIFDGTKNAKIQFPNKTGPETFETGNKHLFLKPNEPSVKKRRNKKDNKMNNTQAQAPRKRKTKTPISQNSKITNYFDKENEPNPADKPKETAKKNKPATFVPPLKENKIISEKNKEENGSSIKSRAAQVDIDLSWVENLKYVRQIDEDEFTLTNGLSENFWRNCEFPPNFDENDFN